jgi:hypothetical protein
MQRCARSRRNQRREWPGTKASTKPAQRTGLDAKTANWNNPPFSHLWCGEGCGELRQAKPVPAEHAAACLNNTPYEFVGSIKACPNNQQLFCWITATKPGARTCDTAVAH